jgi:hypothetical protein
MPQARSGGSRGSGSGTGARRARSSSTKSSRSGSTSSRARSSSTSSRARSSKAGTRASTSSSRSTRTAGGAADASFEAAAQRLRRLNERIIKAGKEAGETTLTSYEKALRTMASALERGPGSSDVEWVSNLATAQAKFIRDVTASWTSAARKMLK